MNKKDQQRISTEFIRLISLSSKIYSNFRFFPKYINLFIRNRDGNFIVDAQKILFKYQLRMTHGARIFYCGVTTYVAPELQSFFITDHHIAVPSFLWSHLDMVPMTYICKNNKIYWLKTSFYSVHDMYDVLELRNLDSNCREWLRGLTDNYQFLRESDEHQDIKILSVEEVNPEEIEFIFRPILQSGTIKRMKNKDRINMFCEFFQICYRELIRNIYI